MNDALYHKAVMRMAATAKGAGGLEPADASAIADNPLCGDRVTMDVTVAGGAVTGVGHKVRGCVLCQASASAIGTHAPGQTPAALREVRAAVAAMLNGGPSGSGPAGSGPAGSGSADRPAPPWTADMEAFQPVADHKSRHQCVLLPFDAPLDAVEKAEAI